MLKNLAKLEVKIGERIFQMLVDQDSPLNEVKEAMFQFQKYLGQVEDALNAQAAKKAEEEKEKQAQSEPQAVSET